MNIMATALVQLVAQHQEDRGVLDRIRKSAINPTSTRWSKTRMPGNLRLFPGGPHCSSKIVRALRK